MWAWAERMVVREREMSVGWVVIWGLGGRVSDWYGYEFPGGWGRTVLRRRDSDTRWLGLLLVALLKHLWYMSAVIVL
jgi:hypothetical protein